MTQAEELLNSLTPDDIALYTAKPGIEDHIIIDDNRNITVPNMLKRIAVQYDNCIETVTFDCPRYWDENDLSTMNIYINYVRSDSVGGLYLAKNIRVDEEDSNIIHFDWLIGDEITIVSGAIQFAISAKKLGEDEELRWYSEINTQMTVSKGLDNADIVVEEHPDILNEILDKVDNMTVDNDVKTAISGLSPIQSRTNIYGVTFDLTSNSSKGVRVGDAVGLHNDYIIGSTYQLNGGVNDFDNIYPWSDMRKCNVKFVELFADGIHIAVIVKEGVGNDKCLFSVSYGLKLVKSNGQATLLNINLFRGSEPKHVFPSFGNSFNVNKMFNANVFGNRVAAPRTTA